MKLEEDFLIAEMYYNTFVMKNEVPSSWKFLLFLLFFCLLRDRVTLCCFGVSALLVLSFVGFGVKCRVRTQSLNSSFLYGGPNV